MRRVIIIILLYLLIIAIVICLLYIRNDQEQYTVTASKNSPAYVVVMAMQPTNEKNHNANIMHNGTLFLLMKDSNKLFYIPTIRQIAPFDKGRFGINPQDPIYNSLYLGRYDEKLHTIFYDTLEAVDILSILYYQTSQIQKIMEEMSEATPYRNKVDSIIIYKARGTQNKYKRVKINRWMFKEKLLNSVSLKQGNTEDIRNQLHRDAKVLTLPHQMNKYLGTEQTTQVPAGL